MGSLHSLFYEGEPGPAVEAPAPLQPPPASASGGSDDFLSARSTHLAALLGDGCVDDALVKFLRRCDAMPGLHDPNEALAFVRAHFAAACEDDTVLNVEERATCAILAGSLPGLPAFGNIVRPIRGLLRVVGAPAHVIVEGAFLEGAVAASAARPTCCTWWRTGPAPRSSSSCARPGAAPLRTWR